MKKTVCVILSAVACVAANATTYWAKVTSSGNIPSCLTFYSNEACTQAVSGVTPTAGDGNTYIIKLWGNSDSYKINAYTAPAGTTWQLGIPSAVPSFNTGYGTYNFGECTIYGMWAQCNVDSLSVWGGTNTLVRSNDPNGNLPIQLYAINGGSGATRGFNMAGTFISASDVLVKFGGGWGSCTQKYDLSGDFSEYKGKFFVKNSAAATILSLTSASAFGDPGEEMSDYLTVTKNVTLVIDPAATQYATKGIVFSLGAAETAFLKVDANKPLTLIVPISGSTGTLEKTGDGTLTLATSVQTTNVIVGAGTLVVDSTASFAANTTLKVKNGATVVSRVGSNIPNVTLDLSDGGSFSYDFTIPFNGTSVTTMDYTSLTSADRALLTKPIAITLSQKITVPQNTAMSLDVARFSASAGFEAADFSDGTEKTYGLPRTSFTMSEPVNGIVTLTMAVKPAITRTGGDKYAPLDAQYTYATTTGGRPDYTSTHVWSDKQAAHPGADYVLLHSSGWSVSTYYAWHTGTQTFVGDSLYLSETLYMKSKRLELPETTFAGGYIEDSNGSPALHTYAGGPYILASGIGFYGNVENASIIRYSIEAEMRGTGTLSLSCRGLSTNPSYITSTNSQFKGKVVVTHQGSPSDVTESTRIEVGHGESLGGAMDAFTADGIKITKYSIVRPQQTMALNAANRGVTIDGFGGFDVGEGKVLTIANPVALAGASGSLIKMGAGSLKIDGVVTREGANSIAVNEGWLRAPGEDVSTAADVSFAAGTGLEIDVASVSANGLNLTGTAALTFADAKLKVRFANTAEVESAGQDFSVAICTVPSGSSLTEGDFAYVHSCRNFKVSVRKETLGDGSFRFMADCTPKGMSLIFR